MKMLSENLKFCLIVEKSESKISKKSINFEIVSTIENFKQIFKMGFYNSNTKEKQRITSIPIARGSTKDWQLNQIGRVRTVDIYF